MVSFQEALKTDNLEALRLIPKGDLHNHAFGGGNRAWISDATGRDIAPVNRPLHSMAEMHEWVGRHIDPLFEGPKGRLTAFEATLVQARHDGVTRLEVGEDIWAITLFDSRRRKAHTRACSDRCAGGARHRMDTAAWNVTARRGIEPEKMARAVFGAWRLQDDRPVR
jgi:hypothetical protein